MPTYAGTRSIGLGAGTLYWAPLGTAEPVSVTAAVPSAWTPLGYTETGSVFSTQSTVSPIIVEEEIDPLENVVTARTTTLTFNLAELTAANLQLVLNQAGATATTLADGTIAIDATTPGSEVRVMLFWSPKYENTVAAGTSQNYEAVLIRQALQTGNLAINRRKAPNVASYAATFTAEKPLTGLAPFRFFKPAALAS